MDDNKHLPDSKRVVFLEGELKRLQKELAKKTREIEVEKALEKVRVKALDMRNSSELSETSTILFQQLKELKIDAVRSGVGIFDDENDAIELWVTSISPNGKLFFVLDYINTGVHVVFENIIQARRSQQLFALTKLEGKDLLQYYKTMSTYAAISRERDNPLTEFYYSFFFSAGTINVVTNEALTQEEEEIMLRLANVFGLLYTRFLDLKKMEEQAILINEEKNVLEATLNNLKATQSQLIQSEKMASLGELTAGIAHEIQNPLNFVNNFSEINAELVDEMKTELSSGNIQSAIEIADTLKDNEEKINHHGKRADSIVKGMLQHSRTSSGQKEPTDINSLADEYLRLAYHGLRAKNKSFHTIIKTEFDRGIGKINVNPQDMGRVILNLINNAFYAVNEKAKQDLNARRDDVTEQGFEPTVTVKTAGTNGKIEIIIKDNGIGIPQKILDKVLQPFFTTKPTGQGTGLGLSLAYDVITKGHGGELKINSVENEGSEFIVTLPVQPD